MSTGGKEDVGEGKTAWQLAYCIVDTVERSNRSPDEQRALRELAQHWRTRRLKADKGRSWVASQLGDVSVVELALFENGMLPLDQLPEDFLKRLDSIFG